MTINKLKTLLICIGFFLPIHLFAQAIPDSILRKIDSIFKGTPDSIPGFAVGIIRNDSLIFSKGYGLANLEYAIPNDPETVFHMASISKQFTGYAILALAKQGKLSLDDDIRKYLKWFPDLKEKITIRNLVNHTSGIRDQWQLLAISGTRLDDVISQDHIVKILSKQRALNFKPGEEYSYSNSGFTMLAEIVKEVSGQTLRQFTDSVIFKPLGMTKTHFHDDYNEIEKNRAYSYHRKDSSNFGNSVLSYSNAGATSLFTTINDMSKWVMNFYTHKLKDESIINQLVIPAKLNNGKELDYAQGIVSNKFKGWRQYSHGGADAGYRTYLTVFPDLKLGFLVFSNLGEEDAGGKAYAIAEYFIKDTSKTVPETKKLRDSAAAILSNPASYQKFIGDFVADNGLRMNLSVKNNQLHYKVDWESNFLIPEKNDTFSIPQAPEIKFVPSIKSKDTTLAIYLPGETFHMTKYQKDTAVSDVILRTYVGRYYCPELECFYGIELKDHQLYLTNSKYSDVKITRINKDHLVNDFWWMNHFKIRWNKQNQVEGFDVNSGRIMHLRFDKVK
jgi:CubicO group peptidase (beta-lactamase class C family)